MYIPVFWKKLRWRLGGPCLCFISLCLYEHESFPVLIQKHKHRNGIRHSEPFIDINAKSKHRPWNPLEGQSASIYIVEFEMNWYRRTMRMTL